MPTTRRGFLGLGIGALAMAVGVKPLASSGNLITSLGTTGYLTGEQMFFALLQGKFLPHSPRYCTDECRHPAWPDIPDAPDGAWIFNDGTVRIS